MKGYSGMENRACATACIASADMPRESAALSRKLSYACCAWPLKYSSSSGVNPRLSASSSAYLFKQPCAAQSELRGAPMRKAAAVRQQLCVPI